MVWHVVVNTILSIRNNKLFFDSPTNMKEVEEKIIFFCLKIVFVQRTQSFSTDGFRNLSHELINKSS